jgi:hypothetical protein
MSDRSAAQGPEQIATPSNRAVVEAVHSPSGRPSGRPLDRLAALPSPSKDGRSSERPFERGYNPLDLKLLGREGACGETAKQKGGQGVENKQSREIARFRAPMMSMTYAPRGETFRFVWRKIRFAFAVSDPVDARNATVHVPLGVFSRFPSASLRAKPFDKLRGAPSASSGQAFRDPRSNAPQNEVLRTRPKAQQTARIGNGAASP